MTKFSFMLESGLRGMPALIARDCESFRKERLPTIWPAAIAPEQWSVIHLASNFTQPNAVETDLSAATRDFIAGHIVSLEELEVLLILYDGKDRDWSASEINERVRSREVSIAKWLETLVSLRLATRSADRYQFAPASDSLARGTAAVAEAYRERRIKVIEFIFSMPNENLLSFVRAFELRKRL